MIKKDKFYNDKVVQKPWGEEYVIYRDSNKLCITLLNINYKKKLLYTVILKKRVDLFY